MISSGGGIVGEKRESIIQNCYYDVSKSSNGYSSSNVEENGIIGKTTQEMQSDDFINLLNSDVFSKDIENINNGYPIIEVFKCTVDYSIKTLTNQNVIVKITSINQLQELDGWELSSDKKTLTKEYTKNIKETILVSDVEENEKQINIEINNIDKTGPSVNVGYSTKNPTRENVTVTITSNEEIQGVQGWTLSSDKKTLTKEYTENTTETITIKDLAGNETQVNIEISNIDKNLPEITIGDINQDGKIDVTDFLMIKRHLVAGNRDIWKLTGDNLSSADMNENGTVDITDMLMLKKVLVDEM